jgi:AcrR family transcriptional regulator
LRIYFEVDYPGTVGRPPASSVVTATPERILDAARAEFAAVGFAQAKLADIAGRAGITRPSLLYHFGSKEELYRAVVQSCFGRLALALTEAMTANTGFLERLRATHASYAAFMTGEPEVARIVLRELLDGTGPGAEILMTQIVPVVAQVERFVLAEGRRFVPTGVPVRAAIMQLATDVAVRAAAGPLRIPLWGDGDHTLALLEQLFVKEQPR